MPDSPSSAAQVMITVIPIVAIVMGSIVAFFFFLWRHQERMRLIESGMEPASKFDVEAFSLIAGLVSTGVGFVLSLFFVAIDGLTYALLGGLIPLAVGLSFLAFHLLRRNESRR